MSTFKFDFALDDDDVDSELSSQLYDSLNISTSTNSVRSLSSNEISQDACTELSLDRLLECLPNVLSYSPIGIPVLPSGSSAATPNITLYRRDLFDARFQLIAQENVTNDPHEGSSIISKDALTFVEAPSDLVPGVYEGGLKTWECSVDLAGYLAGLGPKLKAHGKRIIEIGCGTAVPVSFLLQQIFSSPPEEALDTEIHLQDYNASVLELVSFPNVLLAWYTSPAALSFRASQPPEEGDEDANESDLPVSGDLFSTPALKSAFLASLDTYKIRLRFFSGSWSSFPVASYDVVLTSETIYRSESLSPLLALLKGSAASDDETEHLCLVAAKVLYFGVGGGVEEFVARVKTEGGAVDTVWEIASGVGRRVMSLKWAL